MWILYLLLFVVLIAAFVYFAASREEKQVIVEDILRSGKPNAGLNNEPEN